MTEPTEPPDPGLSVTRGRCGWPGTAGAAGTASAVDAAGTACAAYCWLDDPVRCPWRDVPVARLAMHKGGEG